MLFWFALACCPACSSSSSDAESEKQTWTAPTEVGAVTVYLEAVDHLPKLEMRIGFLQAVDPAPHVQPLATAMIAGRQQCYRASGPIALARVRIELHNKKMLATATNHDGACLAKALNGKSIDDTGELAVELQVKVATSSSAS